jgi:hypothetical protein
VTFPPSRIASAWSLAFEHRDFRGEEAAVVGERLEGNGARAEGNDRRRMMVDDRVRVWTRLVELTVKEALEIEAASARVDGATVDIVLHDVVAVCPSAPGQS